MLILEIVVLITKKFVELLLLMNVKIEKPLSQTKLVRFLLSTEFTDQRLIHFRPRFFRTSLLSTEFTVENQKLPGLFICQGFSSRLVHFIERPFLPFFIFAGRLKRLALHRNRSIPGHRKIKDRRPDQTDSDSNFGPSGQYCIDNTFLA